MSIGYCVRRAIVAGACALWTANAGAAIAQDAVEQFYKGRSISMVVGSSAGGGYDTYARLLSRTFGANIPGNPGIVPQNMPGAVGLQAANWLMHLAPKDGTAIAVVNNAIPFQQTVKGPGVRYDATKFNWIGSTGAKNSALFVWADNPVKSIVDVLAREVTIGGTGAGSSLVVYPTAMNNVLGTKFKVVIGYKSSEEVTLAVQRGEVQARSDGLSSIARQHMDWIENKTITVLAVVGLKRDKLLPDVPLMMEFAKNDEDRATLKLIAAPTALGRPYLAPPSAGTSPLTA